MREPGPAQPSLFRIPRAQEPTKPKARPALRAGLKFSLLAQPIGISGTYAICIERNKSIKSTLPYYYPYYPQLTNFKLNVLENLVIKLKIELTCFAFDDE